MAELTVGTAIMGDSTEQETRVKHSTSGPLAAGDRHIFKINGLNHHHIIRDDHRKIGILPIGRSAH